MMIKFLQTLISIIIEISNNIEETNDRVGYRRNYKNNYTGYKRY